MTSGSNKKMKLFKPHEICKEGRKALGMTQPEMAGVMGLNKQTVWRHETGKTKNIPSDYLYICEIAYLLYVDGRGLEKEAATLLSDLEEADQTMRGARSALWDFARTKGLDKLLKASPDYLENDYKVDSNDLENVDTDSNREAERFAMAVGLKVLKGFKPKMRREVVQAPEEIRERARQVYKRYADVIEDIELLQEELELLKARRKAEDKA